MIPHMNNIWLVEHIRNLGGKNKEKKSQCKKFKIHNYLLMQSSHFTPSTNR